MFDISLLIEIILVLLLVLCSGFFSGSETALTAVSKARIYNLSIEGNKRAKIVHKLRENRESLLSTILLGNNVVNIAATAVATSLAIDLFGNDGVIYATIILTILVLIFGEILPKTFAFQQAEKVALIVAPILEVMIKLFKPATHAVQWIISRIMSLFGIDINNMESLVSANDAIRGTIEMHHQEGEVVKHERDMLGSILDLNKVELSSVMIHRKQLEMINTELSANEIIDLVIKSSHSRLPFWSDDPDNITGVLHAKDMMRLMAEKNGEKIERQEIMDLLSLPWFVPDTTTLNQQLLMFREKKRHFAIVVDEYGVCQGIVTLEDILEEIVGDIVDEHDAQATIGIRRITDDCYHVQGTVTIRDINRLLDWNLPDENATTIAGLILHEARAIPDAGAIFEFYGFRFTVEDKKENQLLKLQVQKINISEITE